jgi:transposase
MSTFAKRLSRALKEGGLSIRDATAWFDRGYATVHSWKTGRRAPTCSADRPFKALQDLEALERHVASLTAAIEKAEADVARRVSE